MDAKWLPRKATEEEMRNVQTEALRLAEELESDEPLGTSRSNIAAELRRLAAVEQELESIKRAISDAEPVAWMHASNHVQVRAPYLSALLGNDGIEPRR